MTAGQPGSASLGAPGPLGQRHPEHREHAAWGAQGGWTGQGPPSARSPDAPAFDEPTGSAPFRAGPRTRDCGLPRQRTAPRPGVPGPGGAAAPPYPDQAGQAGGTAGQRTGPVPRQEFIDAFDPPPPAGDGDGPGGPRRDNGAAAAGTPPRPVKGLTFAGAAAAAVVTVLALVVVGQIADAGHAPRAGTNSAAHRERSRARAVPSPSVSPAAPLTYAQLMAEQYPLDPALALSDTFRTVPGTQRAPGRGEVLKVRVDVEKGLPLSAPLFAEAVFRTLNDSRGWGHGGTRTFERVPSGKADIVITLASPGSTASECAKSDLDTTDDNVSCDSAATPRTMINAYRWAQGSTTYGPSRMLAYRQMLINHEVGHRLGHDHVLCSKDGALAPVMMQQTKFLTTKGRTCKPNPWPYPKG